MTTESDRELLELAAKAAGIELGPVGNEIGGAHFDGEGLCKYSAGGFTTWRWRPLTDDGDALRLAVKLRIDFKNYGETVRTWVGDPVAQKVIASIEELCGSDPYAATRRAITRAAASIGRGEG